jgi:hypothetical protein
MDWSGDKIVMEAAIIRRRRGRAIPDDVLVFAKDLRTKGYYYSMIATKIREKYAIEVSWKTVYRYVNGLDK